MICEQLLGRYNDGTLYHLAHGLQDHEAQVADTETNDEEKEMSTS